MQLRLFELWIWIYWIILLEGMKLEEVTNAGKDRIILSQIFLWEIHEVVKYF